MNLIIRRLVLLGCVALASMAGADETDDVNAARMHYKKGTRAFELGHYADAITEYEAAYKAKDDPALLFNLAQAYRLNSDSVGALRAYKAYLHRIPDAPNGDEVRSRIDELQRAIDEQRRVSPSASPTVAPSPPTSPASPAKSQGTNEALVVSKDASIKRHSPLYRKWWLWTAVGVLVAGGVAAAVAVATTSSHSDGFTTTIPDVGPGPHAAALTVRF